MQIPSELLQFDGKTALILVNGTEEAVFYFAHDGQMEQVENIEFEKIEFSDREDSGRHGSTAFETGTKIEKVKKENRVNFIKSFKEKTEILAKEHKIDLVYLLAPDSILHELEKSLPSSLEGKLAKSFAGNYHKEPPVEILRKITVERGE